MSSSSSPATTNVTTDDACDRNTGPCPSPSHSRNPRAPRNESLGHPATRFKGVLGQGNGHWGAQIYANHERIWLGTFKTEEEAAMAYDSAAIKLRNGDSYRNFGWTITNALEPSFQSQFSTEAVLSMIKDGSYSSKFQAFLDMKCRSAAFEVTPHGLAPVEENRGFSTTKLFQKELTPSDVGKLNRLVIPKKFALKNFPHIAETHEGAAGELNDIQLTFYDTSMRQWKFRYCYWKSSQSYVFTRGWNKFVNEKALKAKDAIRFSLCRCGNKNVIDADAGADGTAFFMIEVIRDKGVAAESSGNDAEDGDVEEELSDRASLVEIDFLGLNSVPIKRENEEESKVTEVASSEREGIKLFGVHIS